MHSAARPVQRRAITGGTSATWLPLPLHCRRCCRRCCSGAWASCWRLPAMPRQSLGPGDCAQLAGSMHASPSHGAPAACTRATTPMPGLPQVSHSSVAFQECNTGCYVAWAAACLQGARPQLPAHGLPGCKPDDGHVSLPGGGHADCHPGHGGSAVGGECGDTPHTCGCCTTTSRRAGKPHSGLPAWPRHAAAGAQCSRAVLLSAAGARAGVPKPRRQGGWVVLSGGCFPSP